MIEFISSNPELTIIIIGAAVALLLAMLGLGLICNPTRQTTDYTSKGRKAKLHWD